MPIVVAAFVLMGYSFLSGVERIASLFLGYPSGATFRCTKLLFTGKTRAISTSKPIYRIETNQDCSGLSETAFQLLSTNLFGRLIQQCNIASYYSTMTFNHDKAFLLVIAVSTFTANLVLLACTHLVWFCW